MLSHAKARQANEWCCCEAEQKHISKVANCESSGEITFPFVAFQPSRRVELRVESPSIPQWWHVSAQGSRNFTRGQSMHHHHQLVFSQGSLEKIYYLDRKTLDHSAHRQAQDSPTSRSRTTERKVTKKKKKEPGRPTKTRFIVTTARKKVAAARQASSQTNRKPFEQKPKRRLTTHTGNLGATTPEG